MSEIILSQSFIKAMNHGRHPEELTLQDEPQCPRRAKANYLEGKRSPPSEAMNKGNYFETILWGMTETGEVANMKLLSSGLKSRDQVRIEANAFMLKDRWSFENGMDWHQLRPKVTVRLNKEYLFRASMDAYSSMNDPAISPVPMKRVIVDLKLTGEVNSTFGKFAWGAPHLMDHTQAYAYSWAYELLHKERIPFYYIVVSYKKFYEWKKVMVDVTDMRIREFKESLRRTIAAIEQYRDADHWPTIPSNNNCPRCPLKDTCPMARTGGNTVII